jgi:cell wall-associated NlpC family hydrolase
MSMRLWPALACLLALLALPASAAARTHHGSTGYDTEEQYYPGEYGGYGDAGYPDQGYGPGGTNVGAAPQAPVGPAAPAPPAPTPVVPEQDAPFEPTEPVTPDLVPATKGTIGGRTAMLRTDGRAAIPRGAPARVRAMIAAANRIVGKPYKWGGGHVRLTDNGYDCSGAVSYSLIGANVLGGVMVSGSLAHWATAGAGRWMTVYANNGHVYMEVAGLRFDTSPVGDPTGRYGVRWRPLIGRRQGFHARHVVGL